MSLTKLFNKNYFIQNVLKSKAIMALIIGIIPILNAIFLMAMSSSTNDIVVADLNVISILNIIGMYVLPIVLSLCLFGYVFKRKSVDFINSMPLTRKTIYITNSIGGILLIIVMMLVNTLLLLIESLILSNLIIPFGMIIDYFIVWTVAYIFVFTAANVATSISGNHITMLVVTAIVLFLAPFIHNYVTGFNGNLYGTPYYIAETSAVDEVKTSEDTYEKASNIRVHMEKISDEMDYTLPYNYISCIFRGEIQTYSVESIIKMLILSGVYFVVGLYLFEKRKMEVNETSFKNNNTHMIVKSLTLIPIGIFAVILINQTSSFMVQLFILGLIIAYCFIYDLITTKTIRNLKLGAIYLIATALICIGLYCIVDNISNKKMEEDMFELKEISAVAFHIDEVEYTSKYIDNKMDNIYMQNEELLKIVKENLNEAQEYKENSMDVYIKLTNGDVYRTDLYLELEDYNKIVNIVLNEEEYIKEYKNIDYSKVQALTVNDITITGKEMEDALTKINSVMENVNLKDAYKLPNIYTTIDLELYINHRNISYCIPMHINGDLLSDYVELTNKHAANLIKEDFRLYDIRIFNYEDDLVSKYESVYDSERKEYFTEYMRNNINEKVDVTKPMLRVKGSVETEEFEYETIEYFTNNVVEYIDFVNNITGGDVNE